MKTTLAMQDILRDPTASAWLRRALLTAADLDPLAAAQDANRLAVVLTERHLSEIREIEVRHRYAVNIYHSFPDPETREVYLSRSEHDELESVLTDLRDEGHIDTFDIIDSPVCNHSTPAEVLTWARKFNDESEDVK